MSMKFWDLYDPHYAQARKFTYKIYVTVVDFAFLRLAVIY
jgi:hypothetical protein